MLVTPSRNEIGLPIVASLVCGSPPPLFELWWATFAAGEGWNPVLESHQPLRFCKPPPETARSTGYVLPLRTKVRDHCSCPFRPCSQTRESNNANRSNDTYEDIPYPAIYFNTRYFPWFPWRFSGMDRTGLLHEAGHMLGLVTRPTGVSFHCTNGTCLMNADIHLHRVS